MEDKDRITEEEQEDVEAHGRKKLLAHEEPSEEGEDDVEAHRKGFKAL